MAKKVYTPEQQIDRLRVYNIVAGSLHLLQAIGFAVILTMLSTQVLFAVTAGCKSLTPSACRSWDPEHAVQATATFDGERVTVDGVRDYRHHAPGEFDVAFDRVELDLGQLQSLDYFLCYPSAKRSAFAHSFLSFGFANGYYLAISVEARREQGEKYSTVMGMRYAA